MPFQSPARLSDGANAPRWTADKIVTFTLTLAATGNVTRAAAATGLSRKSAYALRKSDCAFAALWEQAIAAAHCARRLAAAGRRSAPRQGDKLYEVYDPSFSPLRGDGCDPVRLIADRQRDLFFSGLELRLPAAFRQNRIADPLAKAGKPSDAGRFEERHERLWSDSGAR